MKMVYPCVFKRCFPVLPFLSLLLILATMPASVRSAGYIADADITDHLESEFRFDPAVPFNTIDVNTDRGIVTLTGSVTNLLASERATRIAETLRGVRAVINRIDVVPLTDMTASQSGDAVKQALVYDTATEAYEINVLADEKGGITLSGTVDSWAERNIAETVAKGVNGVVSVRNDIAVRPGSERPDSEIKWEIEKRLHWDTLVGDRLVFVRVDDGKVELSGTVGSAAEKTQTVLDAWVTGVKAVDASSLGVESWARDRTLREKKYVSRSDREIREAVRDALQYDPRVSAFDIDVTASNGVVILRGVVDNIQASKAAERDARHTTGVFGVNSLIKVRTGEVTLDDDRIAANVRGALSRNPFVESQDISVRVKNHVVQLDGIVDSYFDKAEAENVAMRAAGVVEVRNHLVVSYPSALNYDPYVDDWSIYDYPWYTAPTVTSKSDREIKRDIESELRWSPFVDADDVSVSVEAGVATLTGSVDSPGESNAAVQNALQGGAVTVINRLELE